METTTNETTAQSRLLAWCRSKSRGIGVPVMRELWKNGKRDGLGILDLNASEPVPGGYDWETREKRLATGASWDEVEAQIAAKFPESYARFAK